jgi:C4-dicarboxylate-binding protein DctP
MKSLEAKGIHGLSFWPTGFNDITTATRAVRTPEDLKGVKIRVLPSPLLTATFKAWGASPTTIDYKELYTALQQRVVDGQENPLLSISQVSLYEVQKYLSLTEHRLFLYLTMINKKTYDSLPPDLQQVIVKADRDAQTEYLKLFHDEDSAALKLAEDKGMTVVRLTPDEKDAFLKAAQPVYDQFADQIGRDLLQRLQAAARPG